jgi:hypothetical protein
MRTARASNGEGRFRNAQTERQHGSPVLIPWAQPRNSKSAAPAAAHRMVDAEVYLRKISAVTGHKLEKVHQIVERYAIDTEGFAMR